MDSIAADHVDVLVAGQQHLVPSQERFVLQRRVEIAVKIDHHFCDAPLGGRYGATILSQPELPPQGRLDAGSVEDFAFDLRGFQRFVAYQFDLQVGLVFCPDMLEGADKFSRTQQEIPFQRPKSL